MSEETRARFIAAISRVEPELRTMGFHPFAIENQGFATWITYVRSDMKVQFACAPPAYHIEMFLRVGPTTYELADLMRKRVPEEWMRSNELKTSKGDVLSAEAEWYVRLLRVALPEM